MQEKKKIPNLIILPSHCFTMRPPHGGGRVCVVGVERVAKSSSGQPKETQHHVYMIADRGWTGKLYVLWEVSA